MRLTKYLGHIAEHGPEHFVLPTIGRQKQVDRVHSASVPDILVEVPGSQSLPASLYVVDDAT